VAGEPAHRAVDVLRGDLPETVVLGSPALKDGIGVAEVFADGLERPRRMGPSSLTPEYLNPAAQVLG
jgi:hypothetical protein